MIPKQVKLKEELVEDPEVTNPGGGSKTAVKTVRTDFLFKLMSNPEVKAISE